MHNIILLKKSADNVLHQEYLKQEAQQQLKGTP